MATLRKETLTFLQALGDNNDRVWFNANKEKFLEAQADFIAFVDALIPAIAKFDKKVAGLEAKQCVFRIYRDTRFSKDKSPYKTNFAAVLTDKAKSFGLAGYYLHLQPGNTFLAGGMYRPEPNQLAAVRAAMHRHGKKFLHILRDKTFQKNFTVEGEKLARVPQGFDKDDSMGEYLKYKQLIVRHAVDTKKILSSGFSAYCAGIFKSMVPFNQFVNDPVSKMK